MTTTIHPQTFTAPGGEEMVILTRAEYDALIELAADAEEDAADAAIFAERMEALSNGEDSVLPVEVSVEISRGASRLKAIRKWRGKSQVEIAEAVGIAQSYLSSLESGARKMTDDLIDRFASALDVPKAWVAP